MATGRRRPIARPSPAGTPIVDHAPGRSRRAETEEAHNMVPDAGVEYASIFSLPLVHRGACT
jgi:hypothetical protein